MTSSVARWAVTFAAFLVVMVTTFVPIMFGLAKTPLHDGSDVPGSLLLSASAIASAGVAGLAASLLHRLLRRTKPTDVEVE